jgi:hypothetical protein
LYLFALYLAQLRETIMPEQAKAAVQELIRIPGKLEQLLAKKSAKTWPKNMFAPRIFCF